MLTKKSVTYKISMSGVFIAIATVLGTFSIPILGAKMSPIQHFINVVSSVLLGPLYSVACAFVASLLRNILGTGSLLAFPGSIIGAFLAGILYKKYKNLYLALVGEVIGTGIIGAIIAFPVATILLGKEVAIFVYVVPFSVSAIGGGILAYMMLKIPIVRKRLIN